MAIQYALQRSNRRCKRAEIYVQTPYKYYFTEQESRPLNHINDNFKKIIIVRDAPRHWHTESGILVLGIFDFLLNRKSLDL